MTTEEQDALVGRVIRESKEAEAELNRLLVHAEQIAGEIAKLSNEITARVNRAKLAGTIRDLSGHPPLVRSTLSPVVKDSGIELGRLQSYAKVVELDAIDRLDREIGQAVAKALGLRQQREQLGI